MTDFIFRLLMVSIAIFCIMFLVIEMTTIILISIDELKDAIKDHKEKKDKWRKRNALKSKSRSGSRSMGHGM